MGPTVRAGYRCALCCTGRVRNLASWCYSRFIRICVSLPVLCAGNVGDAAAVM